MASEAAEAIKDVVNSTVPALESAGFKKRRNAFNRTTDDGVVQVLGFQLDKVASRSPSPAPRRFTVSVGIFLGDADAPAWVNPSDCQLSRDLEQLAPEVAEAHLALDDVDLASWATFHVLTMYALPWLDERRTRSQVLASGNGAG
jgi:Domain of unknown function (DUF4304)